MTAALAAVRPRPDEVRQLYEAGLSLRQVAERLGTTHTTVRRLLREAGVERLRPPSLHVVPDLPRRSPRPLFVPPERATIAYTTERGWHMTAGPPGWFIELLAELD